jgi:hypothetical protein
MEHREGDEEAMQRECDLFLDEHTADAECGNADHRAAIARRREGAPSWSAIERVDDGGGRRDFLDGRPIHCGVGLDLQAVERHEDDYGGYLVRLRSGSRVRYELVAGEIVLHGNIAGHEFTAPHHKGMHFRWPERQ